MSEQDARISPEQSQEIDTNLASPDEDTRWQAAIALGAFSETCPEAIWPLVEKWGSCLDEDVRAAIATCVLEHILEAHFEPFFGRVERLIQQKNILFADTFSECWQFGEAKLPGNSVRFVRLQAQAEWLWRSQRRKRQLKASLAKERLKQKIRRERNRASALNSSSEKEGYQ